MLFLLYNLFISPVNFDEIWSYGFAYSIGKGYLPYKDFNMVITPFYPFFMSLFLKIFSSNILTVDIVFSLLLTFCSFLLFRMFKEKAYLIILFFFFPHNFSYPNYNTFMFILLIIILYIENKEKNIFKKIDNDYLIGFLIGICILTKQNIGLFLILPSICFFHKNKGKLSKRFLGLSIPLIIFLIYLIISKTFFYFIDLCFLGLFDFTGNNNGLDFYFLISLILIIITIIFIIKEKDKRKVLTYSYVLAFYSILIPIFDFGHFFEAFRAFIIILILKNKRIFFNYKIVVLLIIFLMGLFTFQTNINGGKFIFPNKLKDFNYRLIDEQSLEFIEEINNFINENASQEIIIFTPNAFFFKINNDLKIDKLDVINKGNWGINGSKKILETLRKKKNCLVIIAKGELDKSSQMDKKALNYVINKGKHVKTIRIYDIYYLN